MGRSTEDHITDERGEHKTRTPPILEAGSVVGQRGKLHTDSGKLANLISKT